MKSETTPQSVWVGSLASPEQSEHKNERPHDPFHLRTVEAITPVATTVKFSEVINKPQMPQFTPSVFM